FDRTTGILYGNSGAIGDFFTVNLATGQATSIGATGVGPTFGGGLAANAAGTIFRSPGRLGGPGPGRGQLFPHDHTNGQATSVATLTGAPLASSTLNALTFDGPGTLFGVNNVPSDQAGSPHLVTINTSTGVITDVGQSLNNLDALAFRRDTLAPVPEPT